MWKAFQNFNHSSKNILTNIFLFVNLIICSVVFEWSDFFSYISKISEKGCKAIPVRLNIDYGIYDMAGGTNAEFADFLVVALGILVMIFLFVFAMPSWFLTLTVLGAMKSDYPHWCPETFDLISIPIFFVLNSIYLALLSRLVVWVHQYYKDKPVPKNPLSIYPD